MVLEFPKWPARAALWNQLEDLGTEQARHQQLEKVGPPPRGLQPLVHHPVMELEVAPLSMVGFHLSGPETVPPTLVDDPPPASPALVPTRQLQPGVAAAPGWITAATNDIPGPAPPDAGSTGTQSPRRDAGREHWRCHTDIPAGAAPRNSTPVGPPVIRVLGV